jgi:hypothetical protein
MIATRQLQRHFADGFIAEAVADLWEPWMVTVHSPGYWGGRRDGAGSPRRWQRMASAR